MVGGVDMVPALLQLLAATLELDDIDEITGSTDDGGTAP